MNGNKIAFCIGMNKVGKSEHKIEALIVEDEIDICFLLTGILKKKHLQSSFVNNIHDARDVLDVKEPAILFLDNNLPDGQGIDLIPGIKSSHPLTRIVIITADDTLANKNRAMRAGADFFLGKPFTVDTINRTIDTVMSGVN
jgi:DNA-binding NtrC family response regulator